jgi:hypothetical protein
MIALSLAEKYRGRFVYVRMALFNVDTLALILDPVVVFAGRIDTMTISDTGPTATLSVSCESRLVDLERARERRYTDEDQRELHPSDTSFRYVAALQDKNIEWNQKTNAGATAQSTSAALAAVRRGSGPL